MPERVKLVKAALRSHDPVAFLHGLQGTFLYAGRAAEFSTAAMLCELFEKGEIERILYLKSQWQRSFAERA